MLIISFTTLPYWGIHHLASSQSEFNFEPELIVVMGGSGMPSQTALIRTYHAADVSHFFPEADIIIALPGHLMDSTSDLLRMENELRIRGVSAKIDFENTGTNTRAQAILIKEILQNNTDKKLVVVSSPEHVYRSIKCFKKLGFKSIGGIPAFEKDLEISLEFDARKIGGRHFIPDLGDSSQLRYQFWNHLKYEIILLREYSAILYYKIQAWI